MSSGLTTNDLVDQYQSKIYNQSYNKEKIIEGVKIVDAHINVGEDSDFSEVLRIDERGELIVFPGFRLKQVNRTRLHPNSIKAWHLHLKQDEIWYVMPRYHLLVGLWDLRKNSNTKDIRMRVILGGGKSQLLYIPKGVAHGSANFLNVDVDMLYFVDQLFDKKNPDEKRLNWNILGEDFWQPARD